MKNLLSIATLMMLISAVFVSCSNDDDNNGDGPNSTNFRKIDQEMIGINLQSIALKTDYTWNEDQITKMEEYDENEVVSRTEVTFQNTTSQQITEINVYSESSDFKMAIPSGLKKMIQNYRVHFLGMKTTDLELTMQLKPTYTDGKVTRIDIYGDLMGKTLDHFGYFNISYTNGNQTKISIMMLIPEGPVSEIEALTMNAIWENGNIVTSYSRMLNQQNFQYMTIDSTVFTYDNKVNAYSSLKAYPVFDPQMSSTNNILTASEFGMGLAGLMLYGTTTSTYTYNAENYPISSEESKTDDMGTETWVRKFEYKQ